MSLNPNRCPAVSVVIAARNEEEHLGDCLRALAAQTYPAARIEVIVADGCSSDATVALVRGFASEAPFRVRLANNPKRSAAAGFNAGLREASGDVIVILGARALPASDFLAASVATLASSGADAVGGVVRGRASGFQAEVLGLVLGSRFGIGGARYRLGDTAGEVDTINYGAYRRSVFERFGGFDETMINVEDDDFNYRIRSGGARLFLSPDIHCDYAVRPTLAGLVRQYIRYGYPKPRVLRRHPRQMQPRQFVPPAFVFSLLFGTLSARWWQKGRWLLALTGGSYLLASTMASLVIASRRGWRYLPLLPPAFLGMHLGYGAAFLAGLLRYLIWPWLRHEPEPSQAPTIGRPSTEP